MWTPVENREWVPFPNIPLLADLNQAAFYGRGSALRGLSCIPFAVIVALDPAFKVDRTSTAIPKPMGHLLQAGRNEALERRLRWSKVRLGAVLEAEVGLQSGEFPIQA